METEKGDWVKVKILKHMISIYGSHFPRAIVTIPERVAKNWVELGIAEAIDYASKVELMLVPEPIEFDLNESITINMSDIATAVDMESEAVPEIEPEPEVESEEVPVKPVAKPKAKKVRKPRKK